MTNGIVTVVPTSLAKLSTIAISLHSNTNICLKKDVTVPVVPTALTKLNSTAITLYNNTNTKKYLKKDIIVPQSRDAYL